MAQGNTLKLEAPQFKALTYASHSRRELRNGYTRKRMDVVVIEKGKSSNRKKARWTFEDFLAEAEKLGRQRCDSSH